MPGEHHVVSGTTHSPIQLYPHGLFPSLRDAWRGGSGGGLEHKVLLRGVFCLG